MRQHIPGYIPGSGLALPMTARQPWIVVKIFLEVGPGVPELCNLDELPYVPWPGMTLKIPVTTDSGQSQSRILATVEPNPDLDLGTKETTIWAKVNERQDDECPSEPQKIAGLLMQSGWVLSKLAENQPS